MSLMESDLRLTTCDALGEILARRVCEVLVVDVRPFSDYVVSHLPGAFSVRLSSILLRRLAQNKISFVDILADDQKDRFRSWANGDAHKKVVVYDESSISTDPACCDPKSSLLTVTRSLARDFADVSVLQGGFAMFKATCPNLIEADNDVAGFPMGGMAAGPFGAVGGIAGVGGGGASATNTLGGGDAGLHAPPLSALYPLSAGDCYSADPSGERSPFDRHVRDVKPSQILPFLFIGSQGHAQCRAILEELKITHVLNITSTCPNWFQGPIQYMTIAIKDTWNQNITSYFDDAFRFIDSAKDSGGRILVHCVAGISRSPTITIAYLMRTNGLSLKDASAFVKARRTIISPNLDFLVELEQYERQLNPSLPPAPPVCSPDFVEGMPVNGSSNAPSDAQGSGGNGRGAVCNMDGVADVGGASSGDGGGSGGVGGGNVIHAQNSGQHLGASGYADVRNIVSGSPAPFAVMSASMHASAHGSCDEHTIRTPLTACHFGAAFSPAFSPALSTHPSAVFPPTVSTLLPATPSFAQPIPPYLHSSFPAPNSFAPPPHPSPSSSSAYPHPASSHLFFPPPVTPSLSSASFFPAPPTPSFTTSTSSTPSFFPPTSLSSHCEPPPTTTTTTTLHPSPSFSAHTTLSEHPAPLYPHVTKMASGSPRGSPCFPRRADPQSPCSPAQGIFAL